MNNTNMNAATVAYLNALRALADAIKELGEVPSGKLYASVMAVLTLPQYERMIETLVGSGVIRRESHVLIWNVNQEVKAA